MDYGMIPRQNSDERNCGETSVIQQMTLLVFAGILTMTSSGADGGCLDLDAAITAGLANSEIIQIKGASLDESNAQLDSARASVLPSIALSVSHAISETTADQQTASKIVVTQPIFKGGREYALLRGANSQVEAGKQKIDAEKITVARELTRLYFDTLAAQSEVAALTELHSLSERRHAEIKSRVAIGRSRVTDGLGADAQVSSARAQLDAAKIQLDSLRRSLASATNSAPNSVCDVTLGELPVASWQELRAKIMSRPDLTAGRIISKIASEQVTVARAGHWPSLDLTGNYYLKRAQSQSTSSSSSASNDWDVLLSASLPLFSGGSVNAAVREAKAREIQQNLSVQLAEKNALNEGSDLWERFSASRKQNKVFDESAAKSDAWYRRLAKDERLGLATSLESLQALNASIDARRAAVKARIQVLLTWRTLILAMGDTL